MTHETAKTGLAQASSVTERVRAVENAVFLGMPLDAIEAYLDWLDATRPLPADAWSEPVVEKPQAAAEGGIGGEDESLSPKVPATGGEEDSAGPMPQAAEPN